LKFFHYSLNEQVGGHGDQDLRPDCILDVAKKLLDEQVLRDSFGEELDLPTAFVQSGNDTQFE
jgi:hypothetical protein